LREPENRGTAGMKIEQSQQGTVTVLTPVGALINDDAGAQDNPLAQFAGVLNGHMEKGRTKIIVDMNSVPFIDSEGLEMLLDASERALSKGGGIRIANPSDIVKDIFVATRLAAGIEVYSELADARRSLL